MQRMNTESNPLNKQNANLEAFEVDNSSTGSMGVGERSNLNFLRSRAEAGALRRSQLPVKTALYVGFMFFLGSVLLMLGLGQYYDSWFAKGGADGGDGGIGLSMILLGAFMFIPGSVSLKGYYSILLISHFLSSGSLDRSALHLSYPITSLASHITIILTSPSF